MTQDVKSNDLVGQGQDGSWKGQICKATCMEWLKRQVKEPINVEKQCNRTEDKKSMCAGGFYQI